MTIMYPLLKILFLLVVFIDVAMCGNQADFDKIDSIHPEEPCSRQGGMCVIASDCPSESLTAVKGLCPSQKSQGIECCHGSSVKETRCRKKGGECISRSVSCKLRFTFLAATDCPEATKCCILL